MSSKQKTWLSRYPLTDEIVIYPVLRPPCQVASDGSLRRAEALLPGVEVLLGRVDLLVHLVVRLLVVLGDHRAAGLARVLKLQWKFKQI